MLLQIDNVCGTQNSLPARMVVDFTGSVCLRLARPALTRIGVGCVVVWLGSVLHGPAVSWGRSSKSCCSVRASKQASFSPVCGAHKAAWMRCERTRRRLVFPSRMALVGPSCVPELRSALNGDAAGGGDVFLWTDTCALRGWTPCLRWTLWCDSNSCEDENNSGGLRWVSFFSCSITPMVLVPSSSHRGNSCCFHAADTHRIQLVELFVVPARAACVREPVLRLGVRITPLVCWCLPLPQETQNFLIVHCTIPGLRYDGPAELRETCFQYVHSMASTMTAPLEA